jgi:hypothetical protein
MPVNIRKHNKHNTSKKMYKFHRWAGSILSQSVFFSPKQMSLLPSACCLCTARPLGAQNRNWKKTSRGRNDKLFGMQKDVVEYTKTLKKNSKTQEVCLSAVAQRIYHQGQRPNKLARRPQFCRRNTTKPGLQESKRANLQSQKVSENRNPANDCPPNFYWKIV